MGKPLHILIVEDSEDDVLLLLRELRRSGYDPVYQQVDTAAGMNNALNQQAWDVIISDYHMPHFSGLAALELLQESGLDLPFIIVSGVIGEEIAVEAMRAGAYDYMMKDNLTRLVPAIERELREAEVRREGRRAEQALRESEERLRSVINHAPVILWATDRDGLFTFSAGRGLEALGLQAGQLVGQSLFAVYADNAQIIADARRALAGETFLSTAEVCGIAFEIKYAPVLDQKGAIVGMIGVAIDVTDRKQVEQERIRLATAIEQAAEDIILTDTNGTIEYVNPAFERITGYSRAEVIGQNPRILQSGKHDAKFYQEMWDTIRGGNVWTGRLTNKRKDGTLIEEEATISPIYESSGRIIGYVSVKRDVTEQVKLEAQWQQAQKMEAVGQLAGGVAHDFNNILQAILGYTDLARSSLSSHHPAYADLGQVLKASNRAISLIRQLLIFSRRERLQPERLDLNDVITNLLKMLQRVIGEHIVLEVHVQNGIHTIYADPGQVEQILLNLCVNARDAMPNGGKITIETEDIHFDRHYCQSHPWAKEGDYVLLSVSDTGVGIPPEIQERIFEPFFTTKEVGEGTGLGLATVYAITKQHEGLINVDSEPGHGTTFRIYLPAVESEAKPGLGEKMDIPVVGGTETILLAEDDEVIRDLVVQVLEQAGYRVLVAQDGEEALRLFEQQAETIDMALLDAVMPKQSGRAVYDVIRACRPHMPVLFSTGYGYNILKTGYLPEEGVPLLRKPYSPSELLRKVREMLEAKEQ